MVRVPVVVPSLNGPVKAAWMWSPSVTAVPGRAVQGSPSAAVLGTAVPLTRNRSEEQSGPVMSGSATVVPSPAMALASPA